MNKKKGNLFERYVDVLVFAVIGILCLGLLWMFVLGNPYSVKLDGKVYSPGEIDEAIKLQANRLDEKLKEDYLPRPYTLNKGQEYLSKVDCSISDVPDFSVSLPGFRDKALEGDRKYRVPDIVDIREVAIASIRGSAFVPEEDEAVSPSSPYTSVARKNEDIDFVTVEGKIDIRGLYANFNQHFAGWKVEQPEWRDDNLARPVFAALELERCELLEDDVWSEWEVIPRTKIDPYRVLFSISDSTEDLKYDINLLKLQFEEFEVRRVLLQPDPYEFISQGFAKWLPPKLYAEYSKLIEEENEKKRREEVERRKTENTRERDNTRGGRNEMAGGATGRTARGNRDRTSRRGRDRTAGGRGGGMPTRGSEALGFGLDQRLARPTRRPQDVLREVDTVKINNKMNFDELESITCWVHDDTVTQAGSYKYRMRLGVFNPIVGRDWFYSDEEQFKNQVILWSAYSEPTEAVEIYPMVEFFPVAVTTGENEGMKIRVSKYSSGRWQSKEFDVRLGETIGRLVEPDENLASTAGTGTAASAADPMLMMMRGGPGMDPRMMGMGLGGMGMLGAEPVDYDTGAVLVDVIKSNRWMGRSSLQEREYEELLYTKDGVHIAHLPIQERNWPEALRDSARRIKEAEAETGGKTEFEAGRMQPGEMRPGMMDPMMMQMMMRGGAGGRRPGGGI
jgi:hypothetical protein